MKSVELLLLLALTQPLASKYIVASVQWLANMQCSTQGLPRP